MSNWNDHPDAPDRVLSGSEKHDYYAELEIKAKWAVASEMWHLVEEVHRLANKLEDNDE